MTAASMNILRIAAAAAAFISLVMLTPFSECNSNTIPTTVTLIHRDSSLSSTQRLAKAFQRSLHHHHHHHHQLSAQTPLPNPTISNSEGNYLVNYSIGSLSTSGMPDTGSDLIWAPCSSPASFSTPVPCTPTICDDLTNCNPVGNKCNFTMQHFDGTIAAGDLFADTITFDGTSVSNITFGCDYTGTNEVGTVGLGGGELSLVRQLGKGSFSYCLVSVTDEKNTSKMSFGSPVAGKGVVSVPLLQRPKTKSFYVVALEGMSFGQTKVDNLSPPVDMILDIGTTMTLLPQGLYNKLKNAVIEWASHKAQLMRVHCPRNWNIDLCFNNTDKDLSASFPGVTVYMGCKAVTLGYNNVLVKVGPSDDGQVFLCMAVMPTPNGIPVYGNLAQTDFLVGVDLVQNTVSFKKTICG